MGLAHVSHRGFFFAVVTGLAFAVAGCGDAGPGGPLGQTESPLDTPDLFTNDKTACDYFVGKGLTNFQSAGIVGNLDQESGVNPNAVQSGGPGRGIAQWSVGGRWDTDANDNAVAYASKQGQSVTSLQLQLDFIWYELTTFSGYGLSKLKATTNITDATVVFETDFEGCGTCLQSQRIAYAQAVLPSCAASASIPYAAQFVSQSFPLATTTLTMVEGQVIPSYIELKNTGTKAWDSSTRIGTTQPRDRKSVFEDGTWLGANRPAGVTGTVPPGGTYKFTFDLAAPDAPGDYDEFFGVVEEGVAWFSDPGQGGPPDNDLEVKITVVKGDAGAPPPDAGAPHDAGAAHDAGVTEGDAGHAGDSGVVSPGGDAGSGSSSGGGSSSSGASSGGGGDAGGWDGASPGQSGGCSVGAAGGATPWASALGMMLAVGSVGRRLMRRRR